MTFKLTTIVKVQLGCTGSINLYLRSVENFQVLATVDSTLTFLLTGAFSSGKQERPPSSVKRGAQSMT